MTGPVDKGRLGRPFFRFWAAAHPVAAMGLTGFGLVMLFLGWNAPNHYPPWTTFHLEFFAALGLCFLGLAVFAFPARKPEDAAPGAQPAKTPPDRLPMPPAARAWLLVALLPLLQLAAGQLGFRGDALIGLLYGLGAALALYVGALWAAQQSPLRVLTALWLTLVVSGLVANGLALTQWFRLGAPGWWAMELIDHRPFANLGQPNHFGLLMVMALIAVTALFESRAIAHRGVHGLAVLFLGSGVLISQSRASMLALLIVIACWLATRRRVTTRLRLRDVLAATSAWLLLSLAMEPLQQLLLLQSAESRTVTEVGPRQWIWLHFWAAIGERPWLGYGFNQGVRALAEVAAQVHPSRNVVFAHNLLLDLMTWFGIPLAVLMTLALAGWMLGMLRKIEDPVLMAQRHGVFAIWLALLVQSMLEFPFAHAYFLLPAALLAGAVMTPAASVRVADAATPVRPSRPMAVLAGAAAALLAVTTWEYFQIEEDFRSSRFERANFGVRPDHTHLAKPWVLDQLVALNASARIKIAAGMSVEELQALKALARRFHMLSLRLDYAKALALNGKVDQAELELQVIRSVCHTTQFRKIEREWRAWLLTNQIAMANGAT